MVNHAFPKPRNVKLFSIEKFIKKNLNEFEVVIYLITQEEKY